MLDLRGPRPKQKVCGDGLLLLHCDGGDGGGHRYCWCARRNACCLRPVGDCARGLQCYDGDLHCSGGGLQTSDGFRLKIFSSGSCFGIPKRQGLR